LIPVDAAEVDFESKSPFKGGLMPFYEIDN
jgi:hypothetical protein